MRLTAGHASNADNAADAAHAASADQADEALDIVSKVVVKSINSLKDNVTLAAGANVTIEQTGNTLTISAGGGGASESKGIPTGFETITVNLHGMAAGAKPLVMVRIVSDMRQIDKPGLFTMGSPASDPDAHPDGREEPQRQVWISQDYFMGKYEVTQAQWKEVMTGNPWGISATPGGYSGDNYPVRMVSWEDCACFCNQLSADEGRTPVYNDTTWAIDYGADGYRMPTEAEWENACRAGTTTRYFWGDDLSYTEIGDYAWYSGNNSPSGFKVVGLKLPNSWGLYDMSGNVWEWCNDRYSDTYYTIENIMDPVGPDTGSNRAVRGGGYAASAAHCRSAFRNMCPPTIVDNAMGFRIIRPCP